MPELAELAGPDVLSDVLRILRLRGRVFCRAEFGAPWSIAFPPGSAHFHLMERGTCWILTDDAPRATPVSAGDLVLLPHGTGHRLSDTPKRRPVSLARVVGQQHGDGLPMLQYGGGGAVTSMVCGTFEFETTGLFPFLSVLPGLIVVEGRTGRAPEWFDLSLRFLSAEMRQLQPGTQTIASRLMDLIFVQAVRDWIRQQPEGTGGWLRALRDPQIAKALGIMQTQPERAWHVKGLARQVGMSRSRFASRFGALVGEPPMAYLTRWRMMVAEPMVAGGNLGLHEIAERVGYESEIAFSRAFKRHFKISPARYGRRARSPRAA